MTDVELATCARVLAEHLADVDARFAALDATGRPLTPAEQDLAAVLFARRCQIVIAAERIGIPVDR